MADLPNAFQQINEDQWLLSDPEKGEKYDKYSKDWQHGKNMKSHRQSQQQQSYGGSTHQSYTDFDGDGFSDFSNLCLAKQEPEEEAGREMYLEGGSRAEFQLNLTDVLETHKQTLTVNGKNIRITIPAGIEDGQTIKLRDTELREWTGGPNGDLYITFTITNNASFTRSLLYIL